MNARVAIAVAIQVLLMLVGLVSPLAVMATGATAYLETAPIDPRALFRGDYVTLGYAIGEGILSPERLEDAQETGRTLYVTLTTDRPARFVAVTLERPDLEPGQICLSGRPRQARTRGDVEFPQIAQYFVTEGEGLEIERRVGENLLAEIKVTSRCNAVLLGLETR